MRKLILLAGFIGYMYAHVGAQQPGDSVFNSGQLIHELRITFTNNKWYDTLTHYYTVSSQLDSTIYLMATSVQFDGVMYDSVGCRFKGNSSYNNQSQKKSWKLDFEEFKASNELNGLKQINLNNGFKDPTLLREKICLDFLRHFGIPAPRADYVNVYVNNQLWGLYILVEEVDKAFLKTHFGNKGGNLYKGDPHGDLTFKGSAPASYYSSYELKTNETANDWSDLVWLCDNLSNTPAGQWHDSLYACFNTEDYVKSWATTILFSNLDSYTGSGHNYYIYHNTETDRFEWINWDVNEAFGTFLNGNQASQMASLAMNYIPNPKNSRPLHVKMSADSVYWDSFKHFVCVALSDYFNASTLFPVIDSLHNRIKPSAYADTKKFYSNAQFDANIDSNITGSLGLKPFVVTRYTNLMQQLNGYTCEDLETAISDIEQPFQLHISPNPVTRIIDIQSIPGLNKLYLYSLSGQLIATYEVEGNIKHLEVSSLPAGSYLLTGKLGTGETVTSRFIKL
ncbi:MAG: CotH kinase family protein [Chitinophagales bacterium]